MWLACCCAAFVFESSLPGILRSLVSLGIGHQLRFEGPWFFNSLDSICGEVAHATFPREATFVSKQIEVKKAMKNSDLSSRSSAVAAACRAFAVKLAVSEGDCPADDLAEMKASLSSVSGLAFVMSGEAKCDYSSVINALAAFLGGHLDDDRAGPVCAMMQRLVAIDAEGENSEEAKLADFCSEWMALHLASGVFAKLLEASKGMANTSDGDDKVRGLIAQCARVEQLLSGCASLVAELATQASGSVGVAQGYIKAAGDAAMEATRSALVDKVDKLNEIGGGSTAGKSWLADFKGDQEDWSEVLEFARATLLKGCPAVLGQKIDEVVEACLCHCSSPPVCLTMFWNTAFGGEHQMFSVLSQTRCLNLCFRT
jgi:hypothetical protein